MQIATNVELDLLAKVDAVRGETSRAQWLREVIEERFSSPTVTKSGVGSQDSRAETPESEISSTQSDNQPVLTPVTLKTGLLAGITLYCSPEQVEYLAELAQVPDEPVLEDPQGDAWRDSIGEHEHEAGRLAATRWSDPGRQEHRYYCTQYDNGCLWTTAWL